MLNLCNVSLLYQSNGLKDISFSLPKASFSVVTGLCGSGKSLSLKLCASLLKAQSGHVLLENKPVDYYGKDYFKKVGIMFQNPYISIMSESVWDEIIFSLQCRSLNRIEERAENALDQFNILSLKDENPYYLSQGQLKLLYLAILFASDIDIYLLDEPTANLDFASIKLFFKHLNYLKNHGKTIFVATHHLEYFYHVTDQIIFLKDGYSSNFNRANYYKIDFTSYGISNPNLPLYQQL